ncbi:polysaccharide ABC transporter permease protein (plasmid) [Rhizobium sp. NXC24]|nr:polysaccharide ABC transporter permease protein [Rhizobium sp. NXC24]
MTAMIASLLNYRSFVFGSVRREFEIKYKHSALGPLLLLIQPLTSVLIFTVVFSSVMRARLPGNPSTFAYSIYICAGFLVWSYFTEVITRCSGMFLENAALIKKIAFPKSVLPVIVVISSFLNFFLMFAFFFVFLLIIGELPGVQLLALVPLLIALCAFSLSTGLILGTLNVFFRDIGQMLPIVLQFWFWLTPIVYPISILPERLRWVVAYNPVAIIVQAYQSLFLEGAVANWSSVFAVIALSAALLIIARLLVQRTMSDLVDEL